MQSHATSFNEPAGIEHELNDRLTLGHPTVAQPFTIELRSERATGVFHLCESTLVVQKI